MPTKPERSRLVGPDGAELRFSTSGLQVEARAEGQAPKIVGHAAVFDQWTTLYDGEYWCWREVVRPGAFRNALAEGQDVRALVNHDKAQMVGRTASGTCTLREDATGLLCEIDPPDTQVGRDLVTLIARGDLSGMSFGFRVRANGDRTTTTTQGDKELEDRELLDLDLIDVSIVAIPAYPQTDVALRSLAELRDVPRPRPRTRDRWLDRAAVRIRLAEAE